MLPLISAISEGVLARLSSRKNNDKLDIFILSQELRTILKLLTPILSKLPNINSLTCQDFNDLAFGAFFFDNKFSLIRHDLIIKHFD